MPLFSELQFSQLQTGCGEEENSGSSKGSPPQSERRGPAWAWQLEQVILLDSSKSPSTKAIPSLPQERILTGAAGLEKRSGAGGPHRCTTGL